MSVKWSVHLLYRQSYLFGHPNGPAQGVVVHDLHRPATLEERSVFPENFILHFEVFLSHPAHADAHRQGLGPKNPGVPTDMGVGQDVVDIIQGAPPHDVPPVSPPGLFEVNKSPGVVGVPSDIDIAESNRNRVVKMK